ncbi:hypothetical protein Fmac_017463 [Flemingia macrophylla]|uniref:UDP-glycosyltransferase n=1 Tax=Flemingia macrophylla TaxID=520843 RepID=A0ABD1M2M5_9FABA
MGIPHFLCIPYPVQGHVNPLVQFSLALAKHGCKVTFLHTEFSLKRDNTAASANNFEGSQMKVVTLPDGLGPEDDRSDMAKVILSIKNTMPARLPKLIEYGLGFGNCSQTRDQRLPTKNQAIQLSPNMPTIDTQNFPWRGFNKTLFEHIVQEMQTSELGEWWLCNTVYDLEPEAFSLSPKFLPIGPLVESDSNLSSFWQEDTTCLEWLDQQSPKSVVYVSFGSLATVEPNQFKELALGLDLIDKPFIWVVRPSNDNKKVNANAYPHEFLGSKGKIVGWAPQKKILSHPAIACFISHCGWNSTLEGVCAGVPFLCWPFVSDQYLNKSYICDVWKIGLGLEKDENGIISREEIKKKVDQLVSDKVIKARSLKWKEMIINNIVEGGQSSKNLNFFIDWAK